MATKYWKIVAWPDPHNAKLNLEGGDLSKRTDLMRTSCASGNGKTKGWAVIDGYTSVDDLVARVKAMIPAGDRLDVLEVFDHGTPVACNGIDDDNAKVCGEKFREFKWNDNSHFYLSGCNTALQPKAGKSAITPDSIMRTLRNAMMYSTVAGPDKFPFNITFHGSKGYTFGSYMLDACGDETMETKTNYTFGGKDFPPYDGATNNNGGLCWSDLANS